MAQKIESDKLLVKDVFSKWFRIPEYQRPYVWENDQVSELLDDVMQAQVSNPESQYFLGSMVLRQHEKNDGATKYEEFDLLDGQQRLTTLFLITAVVRDLTPPTNEPRLKSCSEAIFQMANDDDNVPERLRIVFDIRSDVRDFVNEYVKNPGGTKKHRELLDLSNNKETDVSIKNMARALLKIHEFFLENDVNAFFKYLRSNVLMIYVSATELEDAFRLFTVMNNRGVKLRNSDILKAQNLGEIKDKTQREESAKKWEETENYFNEDFDSFLSHLRTILVKKKAAVSLLKEFEDNIYNPKDFDRTNKKYISVPALLNKGIDTISFIDRYKKNYEYIFESDHHNLTNSYEVRNLLNIMQTGFEADYWVAPLLKYYDKYKTENLAPFLKLLNNKFANDWLIGLTPTLRIDKVNAIIEAIDNSTNSDDVLSSSTLVISPQELTDTLSGNIYGKRAARYIMLKLDLLFHGNDKLYGVSHTISIEHILPQNPADSSEWKRQFTDAQREQYTNKLGNLVLISRRKNSSQGNKDYTEKKEKYFKQNIETFSNSVRVYHNFPTWTLADLEKNHIEVLKTIKTGFGIN